jgi:hypothetical protein
MLSLCLLIRFFPALAKIRSNVGLITSAVLVESP